MNTIVRDIRDSLENILATELGSDYKKLAYVFEIEKNNWKQGANGYGVKPGFKQELPGVTKYATYNQTFEIIITKRYQSQSISDSKTMEDFLDMDEQIMAIYREILNTQAGLPGVVLNATNLTTDVPEILEEDNVVVIRATVDCLYRLTLI